MQVCTSVDLVFFIIIIIINILWSIYATNRKPEKRRRSLRGFDGGNSIWIYTVGQRVGTNNNIVLRTIVAVRRSARFGHVAEKLPLETAFGRPCSPSSLCIVIIILWHKYHYVCGRPKTRLTYETQWDGSRYGVRIIIY